MKTPHTEQNHRSGNEPFLDVPVNSHATPI